MSVDTGILLLAGAGFLAYIIRGVTGAASAVVFNAFLAVALALGLLGDVTLLDGLYWIALADLLGSIVLLVVVRRDLRMDPFMWPLLGFSLPIGIALAVLLPSIDIVLLATGLGIALIIAGFYLAARQEPATWDAATLRRRAAPAGIAAGVLSGLYGMAAPVVVIFLAHAGSNTSVFRARATIIAIFFSSARVATLVATGAIDGDRLVSFGVTAPVVLLGLAVGVWLHPRVGRRAFRATLGVTVLLAGVLLVGRTVIG